MRVRRIACLLMVVLCVACGPIGPFSGGRLSGDEGEWPSDWKSATEVAQIQLETEPSDPHSVNLWLAVVDGEAFVATSLLSGVDDPEERAWVSNIETDPRVRVRIEGIVYPARLESVDDASRKARVFEAFRLKYPHLEESRCEAARYFLIVARGELAGR